MSALPQFDPNWHAGFLAMLPAIEAHAKVQFRRLSPERRGDAVQEAIASAYVSFRKLALQGKLQAAYPSTLAIYAVKAVRNRRHVGGSQDSARDALSQAAQVRHGFVAGSYHTDDKGTGSWKTMAIEDRTTSVPDLAAFRIDYASWLGTLSHRDRRIIAAFTSGEHTSTVAKRTGISAARISQLRRRYEREWRIFQGDAIDQSA